MEDLNQVRKSRGTLRINISSNDPNLEIEINGDSPSLRFNTYTRLPLLAAKATINLALTIILFIAGISIFFPLHIGPHTTSILHFAVLLLSGLFLSETYKQIKKLYHRTHVSKFVDRTINISALVDDANYLNIHSSEGHREDTEENDDMC